MPVHTSQNDHHKQINKQVLARLWSKGNPSTHTIDRNATGAATVENSMKFPQKLKMELPFDWQFHCWDYTLRILKLQFKRTYEPQCSQKHYLQYSSAGNSLSK